LRLHHDKIILKIQLLGEGGAQVFIIVYDQYGFVLSHVWNHAWVNKIGKRPNQGVIR
jgi:hypothetical protein